MAAIKIKDVLTDKTRSIDDKVKIAILFQAGFNNPDPKTLDPAKAMADYTFEDGDYIDLTGYFNLIATTLNPTALPMIPVDIQALTAVKDCIDTVTADAKPDPAK